MDKKYNVFLLDADDTLLDFGKTEERALHLAFDQLGLTYSEAAYREYHEINEKLWERLEKGEVTTEQLKILRFSQLFELLGIVCDPEEISGHFMRELGGGAYLMEDARETCELLSRHGKEICLITNGTASVQHSRLAASGLEKYFSQIFISEEVGFHKPDRGFFNFVLSSLPGRSRGEMLIVGDSLTSDIRGGVNSGIDTCWLNAGGKVCGDVTPTYQIRRLLELERFI